MAISEETFAEENTTTALVPLVSPLDVQPFDAEQFKANLAKVQMWTSFTGPVPANLDEFVNLPLKLKGMVMQNLENLDDDGVQTRWVDIRFKTDDGKIISASGKAARQFAALLSEQFGQGDWPVTITVLVRKRKLNGSTKDGQPKYMPTFEVIG